ncbi:MAG: hypothetical protein RIT52_1187, partial [Pseudomonadota bacterium]
TGNHEKDVDAGKTGAESRNACVIKDHPRNCDGAQTVNVSAVSRATVWSSQSAHHFGSGARMRGENLVN